MDGTPVPRSVDILVSDHRVWSVAVDSPNSDGWTRLAWPAALRPYLRGTATVAVRDPASSQILVSRDVTLGLGRRPMEIRNAQGKLLSVNKWLRLGSSLEADADGVQERLLQSASTVTAQLEELGYAAYICSGTLLGAIRRQGLLPHDDDVDLGILLSHSHPSDLTLDSYRLEDQLVALGHTVVRHSSVHLQVMFLQDSGRTDHYVDIFSAFYRNEHEFCQPFHIRADVPRSSIVPTRPLELAGSLLPAPAKPEDWLAACYGPDWQVPDPSFRFRTPAATRRRFDNWFGSQNMNREFWESSYAGEDTVTSSPGDARHLRALSRLLPPGVPVADLGSGSGYQAGVIASHGHPVIGVDYSFRAVALARDGAGPAEFRVLNLYDRRRMLEFGAELVQTRQAWHFNLSHILEGLTAEGRENVFLFLRLVMRPGTFAFATVDTNFSAVRYRPELPQTWHLPLATLRTEAARHGLEVDLIARGRRRTASGPRRTATAVLKQTRPIPASH
ncbi:hypothetical protein EEJ31_11235 [Cryobacterium tepidiphilum]|uniref:LicD/FKTN/FKRP nucleotidyltransferase domain-containing protein n=1 Tax=Cryobacterium tepidiphilum TaxID=2486026 RepID=A0A3M8L0P1_9MICO|nr:hypothetical protein EEJ31_11235 [Cryobacterium tepidiphilum]